MDHSQGDVTQLLMDLVERNARKAAPKLFDLLSEELRRMAQRHIRSERADRTLQGTALVHEAYFRLSAGCQDWRNRAHSFATAASPMRRILVDHARAKHAAKRPGSQQKVGLDGVPLLSAHPYGDIVALDRTLNRLSKVDARQIRIAELLYFGGLTVEEAAEGLGVSTTTIQRDSAVAKA